MSSWSESRFSRELSKLRERWFPKVLIEIKTSGLQYSRYQGSSWVVVDSLRETHSVFEQKTLLIPDAVSFFKLRRFPVESVSKQTLGEAVELDLTRWSPWQEGVEFYYWPKRSGDHWQVAVWVWQSSYLPSTIPSLETKPTHVIPERAWKLAALDIQESGFVYIDGGADGNWVYAEVAEDFATLRIVDIKNETDAKRFKTSLRDESAPVYAATQSNNTALHVEQPREQPREQFWEQSWEYPPNCLTAQYSLPNASALAAGRQPGISDWSDPFVWARPTGALAALYICWLLAEGLVLLKQGDEVQEYSFQASSVSIEVLDARTEVERINGLLAQIDLLRANQLNLESILASLSTTLPNNAWLGHIEYRGDDGGWLEFTGTSEQSSTLAAVLEQIPEVQQAMFLTDIRRDKRTGLEPFKIRLKLAVNEQ